MRPLDLGRPEDVASFERGFYLGFEESHHNRIIRWLWVWDEEGHRLRTRIPYEDQRIWVSRAGSPPEAGVAVNTRMALLQSTAFGFSLPDALSESGSTCEFLAIYSRGDRSLDHFHSSWNEIFRSLQQLGFQNAVATCARKILPLYRRMGAVILEERLIDEQARYFLRFELTRTARWNARLDESKPSCAVVSDPGASLLQATEEIGVLLHRLLPLMDLARGLPDRNFGLAARADGARRVIAAARMRLNAAATDPRQRPHVMIRSHQLTHIEALWQDVAGLAALTPDHPSPDAAGLVESLEMLLLTAVDAWDGNAEAAEALALLTVSDRGPIVESIVAAARESGHDPERLAAAGGLFTAAVVTLHDLAAGLAIRVDPAGFLHS